MISNRELFDPKKIIPEKNYKYSSKYINYCCAYKIREGLIKNYDIYEYVNKKLNDSVRKNKFYSYLLENYRRDDEYSLSITQSNSLTAINKFITIYNNFNTKQNHEIVEELCLCKSNNECDLIKLLGLVTVYYKNNGLNYDVDYICSMVFYLLNKYDFYQVKYDLSLSVIDELDDINIDSNIFHSNIVSLLKEIGINNLYNLNSISINFILAIFIYNLDSFINYISKANISSVQSITEKVYSVIDNIKERELNVLYLRYGYDNSIPMTLNDIGAKFNVTRERIRQIEFKAEKKLIYEVDSLDLYKEINDIFYTLKKDSSYVFIDDFIKYINDKNTYNFIKLIVDVCDRNIHINNDYSIVTNDEIASLDLIIKNAISQLPDVISKLDIEKYDLISKLVIKNNFHSSKRGYYSKYTIRSYDALYSIIDESFENGYHIGSEEDYQKMCDLFNEKFGSDIELPTFRAVQGSLLRADLCLVDYGTLMPTYKVAKLNDSLTKRILEYIKKYDDIVFYRSIYEEFIDDLNEAGINNRFYLKGVLDPKLPSNYKTKRDYISVGKKFISSTDAINKAIEKFDSVVTFDDLRKKFPSSKEYVFSVAISDRTDVIWLSGKKFILLKNVNVSHELYDSIIKEIEFCFNNLKSDIIYSGKVYSRMMILHSDLMSSIPYIDSKFAFNSLIQKILDGSYYFTRQYISKKSYDDLTRMSIIEDFVNNQDVFNNDDLRKFCEKMNMGYLYSYLNFMISHSDKFVQINETECIKKDLLHLDDNKINFIKRELDYYINSFGDIDTSKYNSFSSLPVLRFKWNKHMLAGIVRTYLNDYFDIEYTDSNYKYTEYIIRRTK